jgi:hypothetical protein
VQHLCRRPSQPGDYRERDDTGRLVDVVLIEGVIVTFWVDHAVREVRITFIEFP